jgi:hypothetical protein
MHMGSVTRIGRRMSDGWLISQVARQHSKWLGHARYSKRVHVTLNMCLPFASILLVAS